MLQIKTFKIADWEDVNEFIHSVRLIENGVQVRDNSIIVLYDIADHFDEKSREAALITKLATTEGTLLAAEVEKEYYDEYFNSLDKNKFRCKICSDAKFTSVKEGENTHTTICTQPIHTLEENAEKNKSTMENLTAQIFVIRKMLGLSTHGMQVFGKRKYDYDKEK